jgi:hypothetical protein
MNAEYFENVAKYSKVWQSLACKRIRHGFTHIVCACAYCTVTGNNCLTCSYCESLQSIIVSICDYVSKGK